MNKFAKLLGFDPVKKQTSVKTELIAGSVTFLAMSYILTVNPNQIFGSIDNEYWASAFIATALGAVIGTLLMAFLAKMPLAQAPGMGLNSMLGSIIGGWGGYGKFSPGQAFFLVLTSGLVFMLLTLITVRGKTIRELVFDGMPVSIRSAISIGIGLFIAYIGFQNAGIIVTNGYTQVSFVDFTNWGEQSVNSLVPASEAAKTAAVAFIGIIVITILDRLNVKGSIVFGILTATIAGIPLGITNLELLKGETPGISWKFWENFQNFFAGESTVFGSFTSVFTGEGLIPEGTSVFTVIMIVVTLCMIDMFDTMGTIVGCCSGNRVLSDENDKPYNYSQVMMSDSIATCAGAIIGTSTVTTFVEAGVGVSAGGRTGLTALTAATLFFASMFALPIFATIPSAAAASALIYVGVLMMQHNVKSVNFDNPINATSAFLTIIVMPLGYSITKGIGVGLIFYTVMSTIVYLVKLIKYAAKKDEKPVWEVSAVSIIVAIFFIIYFFVPATLF